MSNAGQLFEPGTREPMRYSTVLVVEGRDMFGFFLALVTELNLHNQIEVRNGGGVPDLYGYLAVLPNISGYGAVTSLGVVVDCETDPRAAFRDLCTALNRVGLSVPAAPLQPTTSPPSPRVTVALLPDPSTPGMLETLIWRSLVSHRHVACVEEYLDCIRKQISQPLAYEDKSRIYAYIAGQDKPWLLLGQAARAGYFPWTSPEFNEIKTFLQGLVLAIP